MIFYGYSLLPTNLIRASLVLSYTYKYIKHILNNNVLLFRIIINYKILRCVVASYCIYS